MSSVTSIGGFELSANPADVAKAKPDVKTAWAMARIEASSNPKDEVLQMLAAGCLDVGVACKLRATYDKPAGGGRLSVKLSEKKALSVYGLQRMPVTLYVQQWERLREFLPELFEYAQEHNAELSRK